MSALDTARGYIARGWAPVPVPYRAKEPILPAWPKLRVTTETVSSYFDDTPRNIGLILGEASGGLTDVDLDTPEAIAIAPYFLPRTPAIFGRASAPASHWLFTIAEPGAEAVRQFKDPETGDMLAELRRGGEKGAQTIAPGSTHKATGEAISWAPGCDGQPAQADAADLVQVVRHVAAATLLARCWPNEGSRHDAALTLGGVLHRAGFAEPQAKIFVEAVARAAGDAEWRDRVRAAEKREGAHARGFPTLEQWIGAKRAKAVAEWLDYPQTEVGPSSAGDALPAAGLDVPWVTGRRGKPVWCPDNACLALEHVEAWKGALAFDEFNQLTLLLRPIPGAPVPLASFRPRELVDTDITSALRWFNRHGYPDATRNTLADAMVAVARETIISPVRFYLEDLAWDGTERIGDWLQTYAGAADTDFIRAAGRAWLISAVARALQPGCKADCALILEGPQGAGKSTLLRTVAGPDWFSDAIRDFTHKDASTALRGRWILELPELAAMRRSDVEAAKAYLSREVERYRPPYARIEVAEPRRCVFAGTTNRTDWLSDDTGGRRFWPVAIGRIDIAAAQRDRDQLWAEAVVAYRAGEAWWLTGTIEREAAAEVALRGEDDPWTAAVLALAQERSEVSTRDVLDGLGIDRLDMTKALSMRAAGILARHGWRRDGKFPAGASRDLARYVPPKERGE